MAAIEVRGLTHRYGRVEALSAVDLAVPEGAIAGLIGPNGSGKTTLLQILLGLRRPTAGRSAVLGRDSRDLSCADRARIGYVAEGQRLPRGMSLAQLERFLAPLYPAWDAGLADRLRERFRLDPSRDLRALSRGETMKAALLCALAPRPRLLLLDEPFTGIDVEVRDDLVRGLLEVAGAEGGTVMICSHDVDELGSLIDWVMALDGGRLRLSEPMETLCARFRWIEITTTGDADLPFDVPGSWLRVERAGGRLRLLTEHADDGLDEAALMRSLPASAHMEVLPATLRDVFIALARQGRGGRVAMEVTA